MLKHLVSLVLIIGFLTACQERQKNADDKTEQNMIKEFFTNYTNAANKNDTDTMISSWAEESDLINHLGQIAVNREDVKKLIENNRKGILKNAQFLDSIEYIRLISPDVALVDVDREIKGAIDEQGRNLDPIVSHGLYVLIKKNGRWQIAAFRGYILSNPIRSI
jgi:uncharacterized protein (TIGR02246 family)